jgi:hypothetical protein
VLALTAAVPIALFLTVGSLALSPEQRAERDLGRFDAAMDLSHFFGVTDDALPLAEDLARLERETSADMVLRLQSFDIRPRSELRPVYVETEWARDPYPGRYEIVAGRWPKSPGEVVVSRNMTTVSDAGTLDAFSGNARLTITGEVVDRFSTSATSILGAPGTWASFDWPVLDARFPNVSAQATVLYRSGGDADVESAIVQEIVAPGTGSVPGPAAVDESVVTRPEVLARDRADLFAQIPALLPTVAWSMPLIGALVVAGAGGLLFHRRIDSLRAVGLAARDARVVVAGAATLVIGVTGIGGLVGGAVIALAARPVVDRLATQPLSFPTPLWPVVAHEAGALVVGAGLVWLGLALRPAMASAARYVRATRWNEGRGDRRWRELVTDVVVGGLVLLVAVQAFTARTDSTALGTLAGALVLALATLPALIRRALSWMPQHDPAWRLTRRRLDADRLRVTTGAALIACLTAPLIAVLVFLHMAQVADRPQQVSAVPRGQVEVDALAPPGLLDLVRSTVPPGTREVPLYSPGSDDRIITLREGGLGAVLTVRSIDDLESLNGGPLPEAQRDVLDRGGLLVTREEERVAGSRPLYSTDIASGDVTPIGSLVTAPADLDPSWALRFPAVVLTATVERLDLPVERNGTVFTELTDDAVAQVSEQVVAAGYDPAMARSYDPQEPLPVPLPVLAAGGVLMISLLAVTVWLSRAQAAALRPYLAALSAIGLPASWGRRVAVRQGVLVVATGLGAGAVTAAVPVAVAVLGPAGLPFGVPWLLLGITAAAVVLSAALGIGFGTRGLTPTERSPG